VSIPVPQIVAKAEEVTKLLRELDALAAPVPAIVAIQTRLPEVRTKLGPEFKSTIDVLEQGPPIGIQERLTQSWQASSSELAGWLEIITTHATQLERELDRLVGLRATWAQTRTDAQASRAPTPVLQNVETVLADIDAARLQLQGQRAATLVLQDQVAEQAKRCQHALAEITRLKLELRAWTDRFDRWLTIKSDLNVAVYAALQDAGMEIPVPQREVRLRPA